ncbi:MAG: hypothetical protein WEA09_06400 [Gemmatimonadota bacterium]
MMNVSQGGASWLRWLPALLLAAVSGGGLALCSSLPLAWSQGETAFLQLSWRVRGEETGECPRPTPEQLAELPPHMQNPDACVGGLPPYDLRLRVDGEEVLQKRVVGGGARGDRPLTVYERVSISPGMREIQVEFQRGSDAQEGTPSAVSLTLEAQAHLDGGEVGLVSRHPATGRLELRRPQR